MRRSQVRFIGEQDGAIEQECIQQPRVKPNSGNGTPEHFWGSFFCLCLPYGFLITTSLLGILSLVEHPSHQSN